MRTKWIHPETADFEAIFRDMNAFNGVHLARKSNNSYHDYAETWTLIRAGKTSTSSLSVADLQQKRDEYQNKAINLWKMNGYHNY